MAGRDRITQEVTDISSADQLLRYAIASQLEQVLRRRGLTQGRIAFGMGLGSTSRTAGPALSVALKRGPTASQLQSFDEILGALAVEPNTAGGLSSLALRLYAGRRQNIKESALIARIPSSWTRGILTDPPVSEAGVLMQASALLSEFIAADKIHSADLIASVRDRYKSEIELLVRRLILISVAPPTAKSYDAQIMLGMLASYAFEQMRDHLESQLRYSPLGFRVWPAVTRLVQLSEGGEHADALRAWVRHLVYDAEELRRSSVSPSSGLDLELAITVPSAWSPPSDDWVGLALWARARNEDVTIEERGTAVMGLWQRAISEARPDLPKVTEELRELIAEFKDPSSRPDAAAGLRWLAIQLEHIIDNRLIVCNDWPDVGEPWFMHVQQAMSELGNSGIPDNLLGGTKNLFLHIILQNAGVYRRLAIDTVVTSGWSEQISRALEYLLRIEKSESWLRGRAEFALGLLQKPDMWTETALTSACEYAYEIVKQEMASGDTSPVRSHVDELHASLLAVGDCFGVTGAEDRARSVRERLRPILEDLSDMTGDQSLRAMILRRPARAATYLLTVAAQPRFGGKKDLSQELLERFTAHPDSVTHKLSSWALSFRFSPDGGIRPFLDSVEHGIHNNIPY